MIILKNAGKKIRDRHVLDDINIEFEEGTIYLLEGPNGSGKTMMLRMLAGLISPTEGEVTFEKKYSYGVIIETPTFLNGDTALKNLRFLAHINRKIDDEQIYEMMKTFDLYNDRNAKVRTFSLGMTQRLALCQALMEEPEVLLLDEPFNALDSTNAGVLTDLLKNEKQKNRIIVIAAHNINPTAGIIVDRIITMEDGTVSNTL